MKPANGLPLDPHELAQLSTPDRGRLYAELGLDNFQISAAEEATRAVVRRKYRGRQRP